MTDERGRRPNWDEEPGSAGKARDFVDPPDGDPPQDSVPIDPPEPPSEEE